MSQSDKKALKRDPVVALHDVLESLPGGIAGAARGIARTPQVLYNKFSESMPGNELTVREALALSRHARSTVFAEAVCEQFDGVFLSLPSGSPTDDDVMQALLDIIRQMGDLSRELTEARADGLIDPSEFAALRLRANRTVTAIMTLVAELEGAVREVPAVMSTPMRTLG